MCGLLMLMIIMISGAHAGENPANPGYCTNTPVVGSSNPSVRSCEDSYNFGYTQTGVHYIYDRQGWRHKVFCQFNGDFTGWVFPSRDMVYTFPPADVSSIYDDRTRAVIRIVNNDGTQSDTIVEQLPEFSMEDLSVFVNENFGFNAWPISTPYLFLGFLNTSFISEGNEYGLTSNAQHFTYNQCDDNRSNRFVFHTEANVVRSGSNHYPLFQSWMNSRVAIPQEFYLPRDECFEFWVDMGFGGCGAGTTTAVWTEASSAALGLAFTRY